MSGDRPPQAGEPGEGNEAPQGDVPRWEVPWPDGMQADSWTPERAALALQFVAAIRKTGSLMQLMSQAAAERIGINATDLNCLNILSFSGQLTAGDLAKATGLTTASITGVIDRLEEAGFVRRERDAADRRRVVVHLETGHALATIAPVFGPMLGAWRRLTDQYTDDELRLIVAFYGQVEGVIRDHLAHLRDQQWEAGGHD
jgi:DNA-binding MarR family transcriptional regulator